MVEISGNYTITDEGDYDRITVAPDNQVVIIVVDEVFENKHIDITASDASVQIRTYHGSSSPANWFEIRNIGIEGQFPTHYSARRPMYVQCTDEGLVENVYVGDGNVGYPFSDAHTGGGIFTFRNHSGHITWRGINVQNFGDNGLYCSSPGDVGAGGSQDFIDCYATGSHIANIRTAGVNDTITNCYAHSPPGDRSFWLKRDSGGADITIEDSHFTTDNPPDDPESDLVGDGHSSVVVRDGNHVTMVDSHFDSTDASTQNNFDSRITMTQGSSFYPEYFMPELAPATPEEAYLGEPAPTPPPPDLGDHEYQLDPNESDTGTFRETLTISGDYTATVFSEDDSDSTLIRVRDRVLPDADLLGYVSAQIGDETELIPVYDPDSIDFPCWRLAVPGGIVAFDIEERSMADYPELSIQTEAGRWAVTSAEEPDEDPEPDPEPDSIIENFDHGNLNAYYQGNLSHYQLTDGWAYSGNYSLSTVPGYYGAAIYSTGEHDRTPVKGDTINFYFRAARNSNEVTDTLRPRFRFGYDNDDFYAATVNFALNEAFVTERHGDGEWLITNTVTTDFIPSFTTIRGTVEWDDTINFRIYNDETGEPLCPWVSHTPQHHIINGGEFGFSLENADADYQIVMDHVEIDE